MATVAELFIKGVARRGCEVIFLNPGTDTFPLQEAYSRLERAGEKLPKLVLCPHEAIAGVAAQGYYIASGKPQVAFVHVDVGTANAVGSLNDAKASRVPMLLCAGTAPNTLLSSVRGSRDKFINWLQDVPDQGALVRNYTKWQQTVVHPAAVAPSIDRAYQIATSAPEGPVYLMFPREVLMAEADLGALDDRRAEPARLLGISEDVASDIVDEVLRADFPLLITGYAGRNPAFRAPAEAFSELLGLPVTEYRGRFNLPLDHPYHLGLNPEDWVPRADLIIVLDHDVPYVPADLPLQPGARVIHIDTDPIKEGIPTWGFPADMALRCDPVASLYTLVEVAKRRVSTLDASGKQKLEERKGTVAGYHKAMWDRVQEQAVPTSPLQVPFISSQLNELVPDALVFEEAVTSGNPFAYHFHPGPNGGYFRNGGSFLGWGLGAALGAKLASPDRDVISVVGDGSFLFGSPVSSLWVSKNYKLPILIVVLNDGGYNSVRLAAQQGYPDGSLVKHGFVGTDIPDQPPFEELARISGAWGKKVERAEEVRPAFEEGLAEVRRGRTALVNITIQSAKRPL